MSAASESELVFAEMKKKKSMEPPDIKPKESVDTLDPLDFGTKKKKKSKILELGEMESPGKDSKDPALDESKPKKKKNAITADKVHELSEKLDDELSFDFKKKKKKTKTVELEQLESAVNEATAEIVSKENTDTPVFTYEMLLSRVFAQMGAQNPELISDQKRRLTMVPPQMARVGTKKTLFMNFAAIYTQLNRDQNHLTAYILAELGTQGSVDANGALLIRGRYQNKHMEAVLRNYCRNYVLCGTCQSSETDLCKDSRLLFLHCRRCGSRITVKNVTSGFQAVTGRRAAIRAKNQ